MKDSEKLFVDYELSFKGKVRDIYNINDNRLLIVTTDRISAFDYVFEDIIPGKGILLTKMTKFWFKLTNQIITNHLLEKNEIKSLNISKKSLLLSSLSIVIKPLITELVIFFGNFCVEADQANRIQ